MSDYVGKGRTFEDARRSAAQEAVRATGVLDAMVAYRVKEIRGVYGGIGGQDDLEVTIEVK